MKTLATSAALIVLLWATFGLAHQKTTVAHHSLPETSEVMYLANEALMVTVGPKKVLFDPFFHKHFGTYQSVPHGIESAIIEGISPFDGVSAVFVSHAHGDHFSVDKMIAYLRRHPNVVLFAPQQAIAQIKFAVKKEPLLSRLRALNLSLESPPVLFNELGLTVDAVRIPHAGWPGRANVENLVFRVTFRAHNTGKPITVMHMGDADPNPNHYSVWKMHWDKTITDLAFPPYWFYLSKDGNDLLNQHLNIRQSVGVHVPIKIPAALKATGKDIFTVPGETRNIPIHETDNLKE